MREPWKAKTILLASREGCERTDEVLIGQFRDMNGNSLGSSGTDADPSYIRESMNTA